MYTDLRELVPEWEQLYSKFNSNCSGVETTSLDLVPPIRGLESFSFVLLYSSAMEDGWSSFVCREHRFCSVLGAGSSRKLESWISVCHSTITVTANCCCCFWNQSDSRMVCYGRLFLFCGELCFSLVWEWREVWAWMQCLVTWICTYIWTSRLPLFRCNGLPCNGFSLRLFLRATHTWVSLVKNSVVCVTKRGCSTVGEAGYRAFSGRPLLVG